MKPKITWNEVTILYRRDRGEGKLLTIDPLDRKAWRTGVKIARRGASQLPGRGPTDVDDAILHAKKKLILALGFGLWDQVSGIWNLELGILTPGLKHLFIVC